MPCSGLNSAASRDFLGLEQQIDGRRAVAGAAGVVGDQPDALAAQRREPLGAQRVEPGNAPAGAAWPLPAARRRNRGRSTSRVRRFAGSASIADAAMVAIRARSGVTSPLPSGWTRFDRNTTNIRVAGSIQSDVPVKPVWPNDPIGRSSPRLPE